ncbi:MAG: ABC transporter permease [Algisphaera sp.]
MTEPIRPSEDSSEAAVTPRDAALAVPHCGWFAGVLFRTFGRPGAMVGGLCVGFVGFCAVFAPLLANSFPLVARQANGELISPLLKYLKPADVALPAVLGLVVLLFLLRKRMGGMWRWALFLLGTVAITSLSYLFVTQPETVVYSGVREQVAAGEITWALYPPIAFSPSDRLRDVPGVTKPLAPTWSAGARAAHVTPTGFTHWLGTDRTGADIASKMIHACRIAMAIGFIATGISLVIGVVLGALMGFFSRSVDLVGMRLVEVFEAIPVLFLLLTFIAFFGRDIYIMMVIIGVTGWTGYARFVRAEFLRLRKQDYVQAAQACGLPLWSILFRHMLPNGITPVLVAASFGIASAILYEATLSFLGLGLIDEPSWGQLLEQATGAGGGFYWWLATFPGLAIFATVLAYNLVGEALRDALDPKATSK